uniref:CSON008112 protein n=1 Tax=Culicoides sonorensis TaxID=179676 RepID=A0A336M3Q2_CULSO
MPKNQADDLAGPSSKRQKTENVCIFCEESYANALLHMVNCEELKRTFSDFNAVKSAQDRYGEDFMQRVANTKVVVENLATQEQQDRALAEYLMKKEDDLTSLRIRVVCTKPNCSRDTDISIQGIEAIESPVRTAIIKEKYPIKSRHAEIVKKLCNEFNLILKTPHRTTDFRVKSNKPEAVKVYSNKRKSTSDSPVASISTNVNPPVPSTSNDCSEIASTSNGNSKSLQNLTQKEPNIESPTQNATVSEQPAKTSALTAAPTRPINTHVEQTMQIEMNNGTSVPIKIGFNVRAANLLSKERQPVISPNTVPSIPEPRGHGPNTNLQSQNLVSSVPFPQQTSPNMQQGIQIANGVPQNVSGYLANSSNSPISNLNNFVDQTYIEQFRQEAEQQRAQLQMFQYQQRQQLQQFDVQQQYQQQQKQQQQQHQHQQQYQQQQQQQYPSNQMRPTNNNMQYLVRPHLMSEPPQRRMSVDQMPMQQMANQPIRPMSMPTVPQNQQAPPTYRFHNMSIPRGHLGQNSQPGPSNAAPGVRHSRPRIKKTVQPPKNLNNAQMNNIPPNGHYALPCRIKVRNPHEINNGPLTERQFQNTNEPCFDKDNYIDNSLSTPPSPPTTPFGQDDLQCVLKITNDVVGLYTFSKHDHNYRNILEHSGPAKEYVKSALLDTTFIRSLYSILQNQQSKGCSLEFVKHQIVQFFNLNVPREYGFLMV